ncbi:hypothetical protein [Acuticoccus mangrovi]|uniref:Alpha/beta hydrolase n=1 Tax=Acuticoccus mangrovi TaxID=2796142 RepID=A0A934MF41_9HYPH|nr:hypothetical protein [Acuticoccus mangrovi]MBJ3775063.1 hypothetical protein [Acuticoccus mangrovi]
MTIRALLFCILATVALAGCVGGSDSASNSCAPLTDRDDDLSAFAGFCGEETNFTEHGVAWRILTFRSGKRGPLFVLPHDNENAAVATAAYGLGRYGGAATMVDSGGTRSNGGIDPNRNFDAGRLSCGKGGSPLFVAAMLAPGGSPVIGLHTNAPGSAATGGSGHVSIRSPYSGATAFASPSATGGFASEDAMVILASRAGPDDGKTRRLTEALNAEGVNVLVETVDTARTDCSLSHYAVANGLTYANIEVPHGAAATQRAILDILMRHL